MTMTAIETPVLKYRQIFGGLAYRIEYRDKTHFVLKDDIVAVYRIIEDENITVEPLR